MDDALDHLLEAVRALSQGPQPRNDVVVVLTDAEEACLCGAEAFASSHPLAGEFVRSTTSVTLADTGRTFLSQVYFYNLETQGQPLIPSGDYLAYKQERERPNR